MTDQPYNLDYEALQQARQTLKEAERVMDGVAWASKGSRAVHLARCAEVCRTADAALFNVLNALDSYLDDPEAARLLDRFLVPLNNQAAE